MVVAAVDDTDETLKFDEILQILYKHLWMRSKGITPEKGDLATLVGVNIDVHIVMSHYRSSTNCV